LEAGDRERVSGGIHQRMRSWFMEPTVAMGRQGWSMQSDAGAPGDAMRSSMKGKRRLTGLRLCGTSL
jgi:hypothetical protein